MLKKIEIFKPKPPSVVTAKDPRTGMKATSLTRGGAIQELEWKVGKKVGFPKITRT